LKKDHNWRWEQEQWVPIFCRTLLFPESMLNYPDFTKPFILTCDASVIAVAAILSHGKIVHDKPISFVSRMLEFIGYTHEDANCMRSSIKFCVVLQ
jgi:hypothetical protein